VDRLGGLLSDPVVRVVVVEHRDGLGRMNSGLVEAAVAASGMAVVLTWLRARLYGGRWAKNRVKRALGCTAQPVVDEPA
jgi:putative resolvase